VKKVYDFFPSIISLETVSFPYCFCNNGSEQNYSETLEKVFEQIRMKDFDIALLGCGAYGHMLTHKIHAVLHKDAYYIGGSITNLFGILTTREATTNIATNEFWITKIPDEFKPPNYKMIENGCYW
jgi:glutamate racemase